MAKHRLGKTLFGLAVLGTAAGAAAAYLTRGAKKPAQDLEEEFQEFENPDGDTKEECSRSYTTIPAGGKEEAKEETAGAKEEA